MPGFQRDKDPSFFLSEFAGTVLIKSQNSEAANDTVNSGNIKLSSWLCPIHSATFSHLLFEQGTHIANNMCYLMGGLGVEILALQ